MILDLSLGQLLKELRSLGQLVEVCLVSSSVGHGVSVTGSVGNSGSVGTVGGHIGLSCGSSSSRTCWRC